MGLPPGEKQALSQIETRLRHSDPDLAVLLECFGGQRPVSRIPARDSFTPVATARQGGRRWRRLTLAVVLLLLAALWVLVLIHPRQPAAGRSCGTSAIAPARCGSAGGTGQRPKARSGGLSRAAHK